MWREVGRWGVDGGREMVWRDLGIWGVEGGREMGCGGR